MDKWVTGTRDILVVIFHKKWRMIAFTRMIITNLFKTRIVLDGNQQADLLNLINVIWITHTVLFN